MDVVTYDYSANHLGKSLTEAMFPVSPDDAAFFAAGSKPEGYIRDLLALHFHKNTDFIAAREWSKRIDLALLSADGPEVLIELKAWTHFNALSEKKLLKSNPKDGIAGAFFSDALKLKNIASDYLQNTAKQPRLFAINIFFGVAVKDPDVPVNGVVKYARDHQKALADSETFDSLCDRGLDSARAFFENEGETCVLKLMSGSTWGVDVRMDAMVIAIN